MFTLLVQGLITKPLLQRWELLGSQTLRQDYQEAIARRAALNRVMSHLSQRASTQLVEPEYHRQLQNQIEEQLIYVQKDIKQLHDKYPHLQDFTVNQLHQDLQAIEADTYAEFMRVGRLNEFPEPLLEKVFQKEEEKTV